MKIYIIFAFIALLTEAASLCFTSRRGVTDIKLPHLYKSTEECKPLGTLALITTITVCLMLYFVSQISLYKNADTVGFIKLYGVLFIVLTCALIDLKRRIIPNELIIIGLAFRVGIYIYEVITLKGEIVSVLKTDLIGFCIGFVFLALVSLITKGSMGMGDAKLFGVIGLTCGAFCTYSTLLISLILSALFSVAAILLKKMGRHDSFPYGPCIAVGYVATILLVGY